MVSQIEMAPQLEKHWMQQQTLQVQQQLSRTPETDRKTEVCSFICTNRYDTVAIYSSMTFQVETENERRD